MRLSVSKRRAKAVQEGCGCSPDMMGDMVTTGAAGGCSWKGSGVGRRRCSSAGQDRSNSSTFSLARTTSSSPCVSSSFIPFVCAEDDQDRSSTEQPAAAARSVAIPVVALRWLSQVQPRFVFLRPLSRRWHDATESLQLMPLRGMQEKYWCWPV